ncbi:hypothetical protein H6P81_013709 [Aristolochia fimbriata]|uniref:Methyltransferase FkbM domain-containing protein n=1 Tax=Aristolochia fimbriata TaxID=158543 RepID=A0AAV7EIB2_ARIFI|nr:hypothetical protein H6P81_013709 [Aristolochia fimbriata]
MANAWKRERPSSLFSPQKFLLILPVSLVLLFFLFKSSNPTLNLSAPSVKSSKFLPSSPIAPFDCFKCPQASPVFANLVEGVKYPFLYSLADLGTPEKPHKNIQRMLKGKRFRKPDISVSVQEALERMRSMGRDGLFVDVGANVGMATFAAAAMGFRVLAFEPVFENLQRTCDGVSLNRAASLVTLFAAAASDRLGNITFHKLVGRLDNSAISETGARLAFQSNEEIAMVVKTIPLDEVISDSEPVILLKIDVQGWEHRVLKGARKLLSRKGSEAPYIIYEEDERLLQASNSSAKEMREFLSSVGYNHCTQHGTDAHCTKD